MTSLDTTTEALLNSKLVTSSDDDLLAEAAARIERMERALRDIKTAVCGEKVPRWADQWSTTQTRSWIADICDWGLQG